MITTYHYYQNIQFFNNLSHFWSSKLVLHPLYQHMLSKNHTSQNWPWMNHPRGMVLKFKQLGRDHTFYFPVNCDLLSLRPQYKHKWIQLFLHVKRMSNVCVFSTVEAEKDCVRCPVCDSRQPRNIRLPILIDREKTKEITELDHIYFYCWWFHV